MITAVIFDMDGVLVDSEEAITLAGIEALKDWGIDAKPDDFKPFTGMGENKFIGGVAEKHGVAFSLDMKDKAYEIYIAKAQERVRVYPWSKTVLDGMAQRGIKIALASAADAIKVACNLRCIGVGKSVFSALVTGSDVKHKKPHPEIFLTAASKAGLEPSKTLVVEDALSGVQAAKAAGMHCLALTTSFSASKLHDAGADFVSQTLNDVFDIIEKHNKT
ncbi:MAG TPA: HAD-IA family hydrolase [Clostridia bacterium]|nr:HAD-IA family hydrolase [Clostridia bacterium]